MYAIELNGVEIKNGGKPYRFANYEVATRYAGNLARSLGNAVPTNYDFELSVETRFTYDTVLIKEVFDESAVDSEDEVF